MNRIEIPVSNPKGALAASTVGIVPVLGLLLLGLGLSDTDAVRVFWPLMVFMALGCIGFLVALVIGVRFMLSGVYAFEYDDVALGIRQIGSPWGRWRRFAWKDISKLGLFKRPGLGTRGALAIFAQGRTYSFGGELKHDDQLKLAEMLYKEWEKRRRQPGGGV